MSNNQEINTNEFLEKAHEYIMQLPYGERANVFQRLRESILNSMGDEIKAKKEQVAFMEDQFNNMSKHS